MSHLTQMAGLATQNFLSAGVGLAVAVALIRGLSRRRADTVGNFWVDLTRGVVFVLLPLSVLRRPGRLHPSGGPVVSAAAVRDRSGRLR
jgi:K+-transporting ATPase A subunit